MKGLGQIGLFSCLLAILVFNFFCWSPFLFRRLIVKMSAVKGRKRAIVVQEGQ